MKATWDYLTNKYGWNLIPIALVVVGLLGIFTWWLLGVESVPEVPDVPPVTAEALVTEIDPEGDLTPAMGVPITIILCFVMAVVVVTGMEILIKTYELDNPTILRRAGVILATVIVVAGILPNVPNLPAISPVVEWVKSLAPWGEFTLTDWFMALTVAITLLGMLIYAVVERGVTLRRIGRLAFVLAFITGLWGFVSRLLDDSLKEEIRAKLDGEFQGLVYSGLNWLIDQDTWVKGAMVGAFILSVAYYLLRSERSTVSAGGSVATATPAPAPARSSGGRGWLSWVILLSLVGGAGYFAYTKGWLDVASILPASPVEVRALKTNPTATVQIDLDQTVHVYLPMGTREEAYWACPTVNVGGLVDFGGAIVFEASGGRSSYYMSFSLTSVAQVMLEQAGVTRPTILFQKVEFYSYTEPPEFLGCVRSNMTYVDKG